MAPRRSIVFRFGLMEAGLVLAVLLGLSACSISSGDDDSGESSVASTVPMPGTVNTKEIGGSGLAVFSAYANDAPVTSQGFSTTVASHSPQLLVARDNAGGVRGLAISYQGAPTIQIDAESTAIALVFLSPGILTLDSIEAGIRIDEYRFLASCVNLATFLRTNLPTKNLTALRDGQDLPTHLTACINEWLSTQSVQIPLLAATAQATTTPSSVGATVVPTASPKPADAGRVHFIFTNTPGDPTNTQVKVQNFGWRYTRLYKVAYDLNNNILQWNRLPLSDNLKGVAPLSWGAIFTANVDNPTEISDVLHRPTNLSKIQYWVIGPGWQKPATADTDLPSALGHGPHTWSNPEDISLGRDTILEYWIPPILGIIDPTGFTKVLAAFIKLGKNSLNAQDAYVLCCNTDATLKERATAMFNLMFSLLDLLESHPEAGAVGLKKLVEGIGFVDKIFQTANFIKAAKDYTQVPHVDFIEIKNGWLGAWSGTMTSTCSQWYSGPMTFWIQLDKEKFEPFDGRLLVTPFPFLGYAWNPDYKGNTAVGPDMTLNGDSLTLSDTLHCQTATMSRGGTIPGCPECK